MDNNELLINDVLDFDERCSYMYYILFRLYYVNVYTLLYHIHKQHNCNGIIEFYKYEYCNCTVCNIFQYYGCGDKEKSLYKCSKCNSIHTIL